MDFYVYDKDLNAVGIIDNYTSVIWTLRYNDAGDFEIYVKSSPALLDMCKIGYYVVRDTDNTVMIIKSVQQVDSTENGDYITITGVSIENILSQRIVWYITMLSGRVEECARGLINDSCINPVDSARIIPNLKLSAIKHFTTEITLTNFTGMNVFTAVKQLCDTGNYGFKITLDNGNFVFEIYEGKDHSKNQTANDFIIFDADNITESTLINDNNAFKNVALIGGSGDELARNYAQYGQASGIDRFETFVDAGDIGQKELLQADGRDALKKTAPVKTFDGEISNYYTYGVDYSLGDIIQIESKQGVTATARITEIIQSVDDSGIYTIPTFSEWEVMA